MDSRQTVQRLAVEKAEPIRMGLWKRKNFWRKKTVQWPNHFGGLFKKGEKALKAHFDVFNSTAAGRNQRREAIEALDAFVRLFPVLREQGMAGLYGDTKNTALLQYFLNPKHGAGQKYAVTVTKPPRMDQIRGEKRYRKGVQGRDLLPQYADLPVQRLVIRFH